MGKQIFIFFFLFNISYGHNLQYKIEEGNAVIIKLFYSDNRPFSFEHYEIYSPEDKKVPYQIGNTDKYGRIIFIPDKAGKWLIKAFSEDGHGISKYFDLSKISKNQQRLDSSDNKNLKVLIGVIIILGIFGLLKSIIWRKNE